MSFYYDLHYKEANNDFEKIIFNYMAWLDNRINYIKKLIPIIEKYKLDQVEFEVTKETYEAFVEFYNDQFKDSMKMFLVKNSFPKSNDIERFSKLIQLNTKPFNEIVEFPLKNDLKITELNDWLLSLIDALESSVLKFIQYSNKFGYSFELIEKNELGVKNPSLIDSLSFNTNPDFYKDINIGFEVKVTPSPAA